MILYDKHGLRVEEENRVMSLWSGDTCQGRCVVSPFTPVSEYFKVLLGLDMKVGKTLIIGGGAFIAQRALETKGHTVTTAETNPRTIRLTKKWFSYTPKNVFVEDGVKTLERKGYYDNIIIDAFNGNSMDLAFVNEAVLATIRRRLYSDGKLFINWIVSDYNGYPPAELPGFNTRHSIVYAHKQYIVQGIKK
jgi:hypothetical protein